MVLKQIHLIYKGRLIVSADRECVSACEDGTRKDNGGELQQSSRTTERHASVGVLLATSRRQPYTPLLLRCIVGGMHPCPLPQRRGVVAICAPSTRAWRKLLNLSLGKSYIDFNYFVILIRRMIDIASSVMVDGGGEHKQSD